MYEQRLLNKWYVRKYIFQVNQSDFLDALTIIDHAIQSETRQKPSLDLEFFNTGASLREVPEWNVPRPIGHSTGLKEIPRHLWRDSNRIVATFMVAATEKTQGVIATITMGQPKPHEIHVDIEPEAVGDRIGRAILNEQNLYPFWAKGLG
jgi:hypothetical protein